MTPTFYLPIAGTWDWNETDDLAWWENGSEFSKFMQVQNFFLRYPSCPFEWSTGLEGLPYTKFRQWKAGAKALAYYLDCPKCNAWPLYDRNFLTHSYGLYVAIYYASWGGKIRNLISVGSPIRYDMDEIVKKALPNIGYWLHLRDDTFDLMGSLGGLFDKNISFSRKNPWSHREDSLKRVGHSELLRNPHKFHHWLENNRLEALRNVPT